MIDLFGLGKRQDPQEPDPPAAAASDGASGEAASPPPRGSQTLWAFLLVLDSIFVIVFAGAVAAKVYQHWMAPAPPPLVAARRRPVKEPARAAEAPASSTETAMADDRAAGRTGTASASRQEAAAPRPPKPSLLADAPRHRETPGLADVGKAPAAPTAASAARDKPPAEDKVKALRVEFKIHAPKARSVELVGAFIVRGGRREMTRQDDGTWTVVLYLNPGGYRYFFAVDKKKQLDPENPHSDKGASLLTVP